MQHRRFSPGAEGLRFQGVGPSVRNGYCNYKISGPFPETSCRKKRAGKFIHPTKLLFNGGVTKALSIRDRIVGVVNTWLAADEGAPIEVLTGNDPDMAVALGAAYYGFAKKTKGIRIRAGAGRSYYIGIESSMPAIPEWLLR